MRITTAAGVIDIELTAAPDVCAACPKAAELTVDVDLNERDVDVVIPLCGDCLAEALAIFLGRAHVRAGGRLLDLSTNPPDANDPFGLGDLVRRAQGEV